MTPHIDGYKRKIHEGGGWELSDPAWLLGERAVQYAQAREEAGFPLPNEGDYVILTEVHEDGECEKYAPPFNSKVGEFIVGKTE